MTKEEARKLLEEEKTLEFGSWSFSHACMVCGDGPDCCYDTLTGADDAIESMERVMTFTKYTWADVQEQS